jgi:hypothetical protein
MNENRAYYALLPLLKSQLVLRAKKKIKVCKTLRRLMATYGAEYWAMSKDIAKQLATFERKF